MRAMLFSLAMALAMLPLAASARVEAEIRLQDKPTARVAGSSLHVEGHQQIVRAMLRNSGKTPQTLGVWSCDYAGQWKSDNPLVSVNQIECKKNGLLQVTLRPGEWYEKKITVSVSADSPVTFSLGFMPYSNNPQTEKDRLWSWRQTVTLPVQ